MFYRNAYANMRKLNLIFDILTSELNSGYRLVLLCTDSIHTRRMSRPWLPKPLYRWAIDMSGHGYLRPYAGEP